jgi:hypothetical protein
MLSRALSLATVTLLIGCFAARPAQAQTQNLEAGKSPSQIFAGTCTACHKSPRGLLKTVPAGSLQGFLRQHYTTSPEMASLLSAFLISNGAADTRYVGAQPKEGREPKSDARPGGPPEQLDRFGRRLRPASPQEGARPEAEPREAAGPDVDGISEPAAGRRGRNAKRLARPGEAPDAGKPAAEGQTPAQAASERGPDGRKLSAKQGLSKRGKRGNEEPPSAEAAKTDAAKTDAVKTDAVKADAVKEEPAKVEAVTDEKPKSEPNSETAKVEGSKPEGSKPSGDDRKPSSEDTKPSEDKPESAKIEAPKEPGSGETPTLRADPVPPVTPAPAASPTVSAAVSGGTAGPSAPPPVQPPPAVTAPAPPLPPVAPAGPPVPPVSQ